MTERWKRIEGIIRKQHAAFVNGETLQSLLARTKNEFPDRQSALRYWLELERKNRFVIDAVIDDFLEAGVWPVVTAEQNLLVFDRLCQALEFLMLFEDRENLFPEPSDEISDKDILEFLLIVYWGHIGRQRHASDRFPLHGLP